MKCKCNGGSCLCTTKFCSICGVATNTLNHKHPTKEDLEKLGGHITTMIDDKQLDLLK